MPAGDEVTIPPTGLDPVLSEDVLSLATLKVETGAQIWLNGNTLSTVGKLEANNGPINGPGRDPSYRSRSNLTSRVRTKSA